MKLLICDIWTFIMIGLKGVENMNHYDAIIIGGGLGGLISGAKLAKEGKKVLLIEQHYIPGGCATTFRRKDYIMEVGLHEMDGLDENDPKVKIFKDLNIFDNVEFLRVPEFYRFVKGKVDIVIPDNREEAIKVLTNEFPKEEKGIKKFFKKIHVIQREINRLPIEKWKMTLLFPIFPLIYPNLVFNTYKTLGNFFDSIIQNEELKLVLLANLQYYYDDPYSMSLIYYSAAQASYFNGGGHFIKGGSQKLSDYLSKFIIDNNGEVLLGNKVVKIMTKGNKAIGVEYQKNSSKEQEIKKVFAKTIIANTAIPNVINLLPEENRKLLREKTEKLIIANSLITIYIGFKKEIKELKNMHYSTFVFDESVKEQSDLIKNHKGNFEKRNFVFVDYSQIDAGLAPKGKSFGVVCTVDYLTDWENLSQEEYKKKKEEVAKIYFQRMERLIPGFTNEIDYYEVGTSKTIERYTLNPGGSAYGFAQIPKQAGIFRIPNESPIKSLYFASAWTNPGGGFTGAILSGWFCAKTILKK